MTRILALDHGARRVGVAVTDEAGITAHPRPPLLAAAPDLFDAIERLVEELDVGEIVVGLPVALDGSEGAAAAKARAFAASVEEATGVRTVMYDERFSSVMAERSLIEMGARRDRRRLRRDGVSAAMFLKDYLESRR